MALMLISNAIAALNDADIELRFVLQVCGYDFGGYLEGISLKFATSCLVNIPRKVWQMFEFI
jgi:hypothetical protein